jgi:hypothetical protein
VPAVAVWYFTVPQKMLLDIVRGLINYT